MIPDRRHLSDDPLGLDSVDDAIRINELHEKAQALGMGSAYMSDDCTPEMQEQFLKNVVDFDSAPISSRFKQLTEAGIELPPPESLDDAALTAKLWEIIIALAERDAYVYHTDHLSDRELYEHLWTDTLREMIAIMPPGSGWINSIDLISSGSEEDIQLGLRYYDSEDQRRHWAEEFPEDVIPPHEKLPHDRDRTLPRPPAIQFQATEDDDEDSEWDENGDDGIARTPSDFG